MIRVICVVGLVMLSLDVQGQGRDCRLDLDELSPIIRRYNPFFAQHTWDKQGQIEMARMGSHRLLMITQDGCIRHHFTFNLILDDEVCQPGLRFWIEEVRSFMHKTYWEQAEYDQFGTQFDTLFAQKLNMYGLGESFNFPIGTRNFICQVEYQPGKGGRVRVEMVVYLFKEQVRTQVPTSPDPR